MRFKLYQNCAVFKVHCSKIFTVPGSRECFGSLCKAIHMKIINRIFFYHMWFCDQYIPQIYVYIYTTYIFPVIATFYVG